MPETVHHQDLLTPATSVVTDCSAIWFPHAGGLSVSAARLAHECEDVCSFHVVNYPWRMEDPPPGSELQSSPESCAADIAAVIERRLPPRVVLYGHSMGAIIAWLVARHLQESQRSRIELLILSGSPPWPAVRDVPYRAWSDEELRTHLVGLDPDLALPHGLALLDDTITALVRKDFSAYDRFTLPSDVRLSCPCLVLGGDRDPVVPVRNLIHWCRFTPAATRFRIAPGGHFFNRAGVLTVATAIREALGPSRPGETV